MTNDPIYFIAIFIVSFFITHKILSKIYFVEIDPLLFITFHSSLVISAVIYEANKIQTSMIAVVIFMHLSFLFGLRFAYSLTLNDISKTKILYGFRSLKERDIQVAMLFFCILYCTYNIYIWINYGLLILAEDPEAYKLQFTTSGMGIISRILSSLIMPVFFFIVLAWRNISLKPRLIAVFTLLLAFASSGKSIIILFIITYLIVLAYKKMVLGEIVRFSYAKLIIMVLLALGFVIFVLYLTYGDAVDSEGQYIYLSFFFERISTAPGLGLTTYLQNSNYFDRILKGDFFAFIWNYLIVPIAAPLRIVEYVPTAGRELGIFITGAEDYGPNPSLYAEGIIYFGFMFCFIYTFTIGILTGILRYLAVVAGLVLSPIIGALFFLYIYYSLLSITTDFLVFMFFVTNYLFILFIISAILKFFSTIKTAIK